MVDAYTNGTEFRYDPGCLLIHGVPGHDCCQNFYHLRLVRQLLPYLSTHDLATVIDSMATSRIDYCNLLYTGQLLSLMKELKLVKKCSITPAVWVIFVYAYSIRTALVAFVANGVPGQIQNYRLRL